ncbi:MAG TPA: zinc ribbon domain-containing protein, partial [Nitrospiraceae bacterium]|jgi:putative FmdB family regulatory protein
MPMYEYRCEGCGEGFEIVQPMSARAEDTVCPHCKAKKAVRLLSAFASKIVGDHKTGFKEMKAYNMLNERMDKFSKLPPIMSKRTPPAPPPSSTGSGSEGDGGTGSS